MSNITQSSTGELEDLAAPEATLYAFYDLSISAPKYDYLTFLLIADMHRRRYGFKHIYFVFVPGFVSGFRGAHLPPNDPETLMAMMRNIVLPSCWLLSACSGVSYVSERGHAQSFLDQAGENVFPRGYTIEQPLTDYLPSGINAALVRGEKLCPLEPSAEYVAQAIAFRELIAGDRKLLTITLRECEYHPNRNSRLEEWKIFIEQIDTAEYCVVVVRDTATAHADPIFNGVPESPLASICLGFRAALYTQSYLTLHVSNGTSCVANYSYAPSITFGVYDDDYLHGMLKFTKINLGQSFGDSWYGFPVCQKLVWEKETAKLIKLEFDLMVTLLEKTYEERYAPRDFGSLLQLMDTCNSVVEYTAHNMQFKHLIEDRDVLLSVLKLTEEKHSLAWNLLGVWYAGNGEAELAVDAFGKAIECDPDFQMAHSNHAAILEQLENNRDVLN